MVVNLRPYQQDCLTEILTKYQEGIRHQVAVLATGTGKTHIFSHLASQFVEKTQKKVLIIAHREELLIQAQQKLSNIDPSLHIGIEQAQSFADHKNDDVVIASVQTLGKGNKKRLARFDPDTFCLIIIDEAHHFSIENSTYTNIIRHFKVLKSEPDNDISAALLLGVTATPQRGDHIGLEKAFDEVVYNYGILDGIKDGWLSRIRAYRVDTKTSLENVHTFGGDFKQDELADAINNAERNDLVVKTYLDQFKGKQALVFAIDVEHAIALQKAFVDKHVTAAVITGTTPKFERHTTLNLFHEKQINVVINCMVLTEGYDNDTIDTIMMARPTKSGILYQQMVGRGTRTHHEKPYLTVVDFVDNTYRHTIKTTASLFGIPGMVDFNGEDVVDGLKKINEIRELNPDFNLDRLSFAKLDYVMEEVDLLGGLDIPNELKPMTPHAWHRFGSDAFRVGIGNSQYFIIEQKLTGQWETRFEAWDAITKQVNSKVLGQEETLEWIVSRVDKFIVNNYPDALRLINMQARWRKDPVTENQAFALKKLGVAEEIITQLDKGKASQLQTKLYAKMKQWR